MEIAVLIAGLLVLAVVAVLVTGRQRSTTGRLARETRKSDRSAGPEAVVPEGEESIEEEAEEARARADEARHAIESGASVGEVVPSAAKTPAVYEPVDEEQLGVTRRQFFNRSILAGSGIGLGAFGVASLAFLWPSGGAASQVKVAVGSEADVKTAFDAKIPFYNATAKTYIVAYPKADLPKAKKVYNPLVFAGMQEGYVALYQKCVHLGCRVPWCESSQWFECPCHGSKYNRVGEKREGPAPRGLDRFPLEISGGNIVVDTGNLQIGPAIGTNTTGQSPEGAPCV
ncbi:MAG: ubiquinol-cytochrome c reductase iron-sulfur subunit [Acidimicrobiia bacterium]